MKEIIVFLIMLFPVGALAQEPIVPASALRELSKDLSQMQQVVADAQRDSLVANPSLVAVKAPTAAIYSEPKQNAAVVDTARAGEPFRVVQRSGAWLEVQTDSNSFGWLFANAVGPVYTAASVGIPSSEELFAKLTDMASKMRDRYRNNPYISITGFTVEIGVTPSVSIDFEFKQ